MKPIKELLELMLDQYQNNPDSDIRCKGLCYAVINVRYRDLITQEEERLLKRYLKENRPKYSRLTGFWWPKGKTAPRIEFLKKLISEL